MIEIRNVSKSYGNVKALDDVSVTINRGEIIGLFGENGAGKTTFIKSVFGFIPFKGEILLDGEKINRKNIGKLSFATSEHSFFPEINAAERGVIHNFSVGVCECKPAKVLIDGHLDKVTCIDFGIDAVFIVHL